MSESTEVMARVERISQLQRMYTVWGRLDICFNCGAGTMCIRYAQPTPLRFCKPSEVFKPAPRIETSQCIICYGTKYD